MSLFKNRFKKVESQNVSTTSEGNANVPRVIEPKMPSPMAIAEISKAVMANMTNQVEEKEEEKDDKPMEMSMMNKQLDDRIELKIKELEIKKQAIDMALEILRGN